MTYPPTPSDVRAAVARSGVPYVLEPGWDDPTIAAQQGAWAPAYVILHHTGTATLPVNGDAPSLPWIITHPVYKPIRAAHFLVARSGLVHVTYSLACYHAGSGGPGVWGDGSYVAADTMNTRSYGIELESAGLSLDTTAQNGRDGILPAQYQSSARLAAALLDLLGRATSCAINHRTWAPTRKTDTRDTDTHWHELIDAARHPAPQPTPTPVPPPTTKDETVIVIRDTGTGASYLYPTMTAIGLHTLQQLQAAGPVQITPLDSSVVAQLLHDAGRV